MGDMLKQAMGPSFNTANPFQAPPASPPPTPPTQPAPTKSVNYQMGPRTAPGMVAPGNIDLWGRPRVRNDDGSVSTIRNATFTIEDPQSPYYGKTVMLPTVMDNGTIVSPHDAYQNYRKTGKHLGIFDTPENADLYYGGADRKGGIHAQQSVYFQMLGDAPKGPGA